MSFSLATKVTFLVGRRRPVGSLQSPILPTVGGLVAWYLSLCYVGLPYEHRTKNQSSN